MNSIPTLSQLQTTLKNLLSSLFNTVIRSDSVLATFAIAIASMLKPLWLGIAKTQKNILPDTADPGSGGGTLDGWGWIALKRNRYQAVQGQYLVSVTGSVGANIPAGSSFLSSDTSLSPTNVYVLDYDFTMSATTDTITLRAVVAGSTSALNVGNTLVPINPISGVDNLATVIEISVVPVDEEDIEVFRKKIITNYRLFPGSWSAIDYRLIGANVSGVNEIYAYLYSSHYGQVNVFIEGNTAGVAPSVTVINNVRDAIELKRPLGVLQVNYLACPIKNIVVTIAQITGYTLTSAQRTNIFNALTEAINKVRPFIAACDVLAERNDTISTTYGGLYSTNIQTIISSAIPGVPFGTVSFTLDGTPTATYLFENGQIPYLSNVIYA